MGPYYSPILLSYHIQYLKFITQNYSFIFRFFFYYLFTEQLTKNKTVVNNHIIICIEQMMMLWDLGIMK